MKVTGRQRLLQQFLAFMLRIIFPVAVVLAILVFVFLLHGRILLITSWHHDLGGIEPNVVYGIQRMLDGQSLYSDPNKPPYAIIMYSPLYYHVVTFFAKVIGTNPHEPIEVYRISRIMSLLFNLSFIGVLMLTLIRHFHIKWMAAIIAGALVFSYLRITDFGRPDSLYHLLALLTIAGGVEYLRTRRLGWGILTIVVSAGCLFAKQTGLIVVIILLFYVFFYEKPWKRFTQTIGILGVSFLMLGLVMSGDFYIFWQNVFQGVNNGISWDWFRRKILFFYLHEIAIFSGIVLSLVAMFLIKSDTPSKKFMSITVFGFFFFALAISMKWGSMPSYFTMFITIGWIIIFIVLYDDRWEYLANYRNAFLGVLAICCFATEVPRKHLSYRLETDNTRYEQARQASDYLKNEFQLKPDERVLILVDYQYLMERHYLNNFLFQHAILPTKDIFTCCAYPTKAYDYSLLEQQAETGLITYIIRNRNSSEGQFFDWHFKNFEKAAELDAYSIYKVSL